MALVRKHGGGVLTGIWYKIGGSKELNLHPILFWEWKSLVRFEF